MIAISECACGNAVSGDGVRCDTCKALQALDLEPGASRKEIESAYRVLVKVWHPDRFQSDLKLKASAEEKLKAINLAHGYLLSIEDRKPQRRRRPAPQRQESAKSKEGESNSDPDARGFRLRRRSFIDPSVVTRILIRGSILLCGLSFAAFLVFGLDSFLSSNPSTGRFYSNYRGQIISRIQSQNSWFWDSVQTSVHPTGITSATPATAALAQPDPASLPEALQQPPKIPMPYVTTGLTRDEVIEVMGTPIASIGNTLVYSRAIFYLKGGVVTGWRVDRALIPLRVKLWPTGHAGAHLETFTIGSSKDEVVAVQGTPNLLSRAKFDYGTSQVFFENDRVIGWMNDHNSIQLRTAAH